MTTRKEENTATLDIARLVRDAAAGNRWAWERLVDQYSRLIWAITRDFKLMESDAADVTQVTWLRLFEHIHRLESPDRVGSWLAATARNECLRSLAARKKMVLGHDDLAFERGATPEPEVDERLLAEESAQMVREAISCLPRRWQQLLELLMADPPASYAEISDKLGLPIGSIGPTRGRCLARLRELLPSVSKSGYRFQRPSTTGFPNPRSVSLRTITPDRYGDTRTAAALASWPEKSRCPGQSGALAESA